MGFEPTTPTLATLCSTTELLPLESKIYMVPETGLEPVRYCYRGILSPLCLPFPPLRHIIFKKNGGDTQIRTGDGDFADLCLTTWRCRLNLIHKHTITVLMVMEREMGFEPTTPTLATLCSTTELLPHDHVRI